MIYRVKNVSDEEFRFEGVVIPSGGVSEDLAPETYQRLLALYINRVLVPVDESTFGSVKQESSEGQPEALSEAEVVSSTGDSSPEEEKPKRRGRRKKLDQ